MRQVGQVGPLRYAERDPRRQRVHHLLGRPVRHDVPALHDRHSVGEHLRLFEVVRGEQDGGPARLQLADDIPRAAPRRRVHAGGRLVEEEHLRPAHHGQRQLQPPALAAGELLDGDVGPVGQLHRLEHVAGGARTDDERTPGLDGLAYGQGAGETAVLEHHAGPRTHRGAVGDRVQAEHPHLAGGRPLQPLERLDRGRLAGAIGAQQREQLAATDGQRHPPDRLEPPIAATQLVHLNDDVFHDISLSIREPNANPRVVMIRLCRLHG